MRLKNISIKIKLMVYSGLTIGLTVLVISIVLYNTSEGIIRKQVGNFFKGLKTISASKMKDNYKDTVTYDTFAGWVSSAWMPMKKGLRILRSA